MLLYYHGRKSIFFLSFVCFNHKQSEDSRRNKLTSRCVIEKNLQKIKKKLRKNIRHPFISPTKKGERDEMRFGAKTSFPKMSSLFQKASLWSFSVLLITLPLTKPREWVRFLRWPEKELKNLNFLLNFNFLFGANVHPPERKTTTTTSPIRPTTLVASPRMC